MSPACRRTSSDTTALLNLLKTIADLILIASTLQARNTGCSSRPGRLRRRFGLGACAAHDRDRHTLAAELLCRAAAGHEQIDFAALDLAAAVLHGIDAVVALQPADTNHSAERQYVRIRSDHPFRS